VTMSAPIRGQRSASGSPSLRDLSYPSRPCMARGCIKSHSGSAFCTVNG
jgi:hypothetical protein